ncbi:hypothetical protein [Flavobacterium suzhouense]|uniref:Uncharacterized protein n=1 Tax=Flavobacterium suzhouense TaxID=1529638 RepID=A0ABW5NW84_9FLAO
MTEYEIVSNKKDVFLKSKEPKLKIELYNDIAPYISINQSLIIEITNHSKTLLFISHSENNLLDEN